MANLVGVTQAHISKGLSPWHVAFLSLGLLHLSIHCQNKTREYQETPKFIFCMPNTFLHVPIVISSTFFDVQVTSVMVVTLLVCWSFDTGVQYSGNLSYPLAYGSEYYPAV